MVAVLKLKCCARCRLDLLDDCFGTDKSRPDGRSVYCLACNRLFTNEYRERKRKMIREIGELTFNKKRCPKCRLLIEVSDLDEELELCRWCVKETVLNDQQTFRDFEDKGLTLAE